MAPVSILARQWSKSAVSWYGPLDGYQAEAGAPVTIKLIARFASPARVVVASSPTYSKHTVLLVGTGLRYRMFLPGVQDPYKSPLSASRYDVTLTWSPGSV
jgi:hypothetical protein